MLRDDSYVRFVRINIRLASDEPPDEAGAILLDTIFPVNDAFRHRLDIAAEGTDAAEELRKLSEKYNGRNNAYNCRKPLPIGLVVEKAPVNGGKVLVAGRSTQRIKSELRLQWNVWVRVPGQMEPKVIVEPELAGFSDVAMLIFQIDGVPTIIPDINVVVVFDLGTIL
jgi:hypothetical protein